MSIELRQIYEKRDDTVVASLNGVINLKLFPH